MTCAVSACGLKRDRAAEKAHANTGNVYAFLEGNPSFKPILFSAHLDTVPPGKNIRPVVEQGVIRSAGNTVLGADDKSGVAAIVEALRLIVSQKIPHRPIEVAFTISEEVGLLGAKYLDYTRFQSRQAVVFDNEGDVGTIVNQAPGHMEILGNHYRKSSSRRCCPGRRHQRNSGLPPMR